MGWLKKNLSVPLCLRVINNEDLTRSHGDTGGLENWMLRVGCWATWGQLGSCEHSTANKERPTFKVFYIFFGVFLGVTDSCSVFWGHR